MRRPPNLMKSVTAPVTVQAEAKPPPPANYLDLYGLSKPPFDGGANNAGYILFGSHRRPFELLIDHVVNGTGVIVLQGGEGIGKTETLRSLADLAAESGQPTIMITRPPNDRISLEQFISKLRGDSTNDGATIDDVIADFVAPPRKALLVDDVDLMPGDCVRLLSALVQQMPNDPGGPAIVLSSSAVLPTDPMRPDLSQLVDHVRNTVRLLPLGSAEVQQYIERSLWIAGGTTRRLIAADAMRLLIARSGGVPGATNRLMEAVLTAGFARGDSMITAKTVAAVTGPTTPRPQPRPRSGGPPSGIGRACDANCRDRIAGPGGLGVSVQRFQRPSRSSLRRVGKACCARGAFGATGHDTAGTATTAAGEAGRNIAARIDGSTHETR